MTLPSIIMTGYSNKIGGKGMFMVTEFKYVMGGQQVWVTIAGYLGYKWYMNRMVKDL